jgi:hypothetical protein
MCASSSTTLILIGASSFPQDHRMSVIHDGQLEHDRSSESRSAMLA